VLHLGPLLLLSSSSASDAAFASMRILCQTPPVLIAVFPTAPCLIVFACGCSGIGMSYEARLVTLLAAACSLVLLVSLFGDRHLLRVLLQHAEGQQNRILTGDASHTAMMDDFTASTSALLSHAAPTAKPPTRLSRNVVTIIFTTTTMATTTTIENIARVSTATPGRGSSHACGQRGSDFSPLRDLRTSSRIVNGQKSTPCEWRWQVSLQHLYGHHFCGGTLISPRWVLTAAHCVVGRRPFYVIAGGFRRLSGSEESLVRRSARRIIRHPEYNRRTHHLDFALIDLNEEVPINECIGTACIPKGEITPSGQCYITGWGTLNFGGSSPDAHQEAVVDIVNDTTCNMSYAGRLSSTMLCAQGNSSKGITDTCRGDSGGPLVCQETSGQFALYGVTSWGRGCGNPQYPGIYARVSRVLDWINETMGTVYTTTTTTTTSSQRLEFVNDSFWNVSSGPCTIDRTGCLLSPNWPKNYGNNEACEIAVNSKNIPKPIFSISFVTEYRYDVLRVNKVSYSGFTGPSHVTPTETITWTSDYSITKSGWKLCTGVASASVALMLESTPMASESHASLQVDQLCGVQGHSSNSPMVNKEDTTPCTWPWQVSLRTLTGFQFCSGTLISRKWVLTGAHCTRRHNFTVALGDFNKDPSSDRHKRHVVVSRVVVHPSFNSTSFDNDLALLELSEEVTSSPCIKPICLPEHDIFNLTDSGCVITGSGIPEQNGRLPSIVQDAPIHVLNTATCNKSYGGFMTGSMFCAQSRLTTGALIDMCSWGTGGPLVCALPNGSFTIQGVASIGLGCTIASYRGVYSRVFPVLSWIVNIVHNRTTTDNPN